MLDAMRDPLWVNLDVCRWSQIKDHCYLNKVFLDKRAKRAFYSPNLRLDLILSLILKLDLSLIMNYLNLNLKLGMNIESRFE